MTGIVATLEGGSSSLTTYFHPELELDDRFTYACALLDFTYKPAPNVHEKNNKFHYAKLKFINANNYVIEMPTGSYSFQDIANFIERESEKNGNRIKIRFNKETLKVTMDTNNKDICINFQDHPNSIGGLLGFDSEVYCGRKQYESQHAMKIDTTKRIRIDCDLTTGTFHNGSITHTIHEFELTQNQLDLDDSFGYIITEQPRNLIYLPITRRRISNINITAFNQDGEPIEVDGGHISCRVHIQRC